MIKKIEKYSRVIIYFFAFIIPAIFMLIISVSLNYYPFGTVSSLVADTQVQFVDYFSYLKSVFFGNNDLFYSFSKTLGGEMAGFSFYYLANPLSYLLLFVPNKSLSAGILFMIILHMSLSSLFFCIMLNNIYGTRWSSVIFSVAYAFMGYFLAYFNCILYFNNVMILPFIVLGIYEMVVKEKKNYKYIVFLAYSIITSYYMGFMTCIFSVMIFVYFLITVSKKNITPVRVVRVIGIFIASSALAGSLSAVSLFTVLSALKEQKPNSGLSQLLSFSFNFNIRDLFAGLYSTGFNGNISTGMPVIYCSVIVVIFAFLYFLNKEISLKEKIATIVFILFLIISFDFDSLNVMWHGFAHPVGFPYRNSFLFSFILIFIGYKGFILIKQGTRKYHTLIIMCIFVFYSVYLLLSNNAYVGRVQVVLTGAFVSMILAGIYAICYKREYMYPITFGFFVIFSFDVLLNGYYSLSRYDTYDMSYYEEFDNNIGDAVDYIKENDDSFYRIDKLYRRTHNDAMHYNYNGLSHFSSCESYPVKLFMGNLGFPSNDMWAFYGIEGNTAFADCLLDLKYFVTQYDETKKPYELKKRLRDLYIFENPYNLNLAFGSKETISEVSVEKKNHFTYQNAIAKGITGETYGIYRPVEVKDIVLNNVSKKDKTYSIINPDEEAYIEYLLAVDSTDFIYMYFTYPDDRITDLSVNGDSKPPYFTIYNQGVRCAGYFNKGDIVPVRITLHQSDLTIDNYEFYYENIDELLRWHEDASKSSCDIKKITSSHLLINADIDKDDDMLVLSVPYDEAWAIKVDGEEINKEIVLDVLMAIKMTPGRHVIEMSYTPKGLMAGSVISVISLIILASIFVSDKYNQKRMIKGE